MRFISSFLNWLTFDTVQSMRVAPKAVLVPIRARRITKKKSNYIQHF